ncbi:MAG: NAD-dependent epimerase/dehydratase family protein [Jatrophihabitantaceae bacterium]
MHALVTGGLGYIGHAVTHDLTMAGWDVTILSSRQATGSAPPPHGATVVYGDLLERDRLTQIFAENDFDTVIHLAGLARARESFEMPLAYFDVNVGGTANLLRVMDALPDDRRMPTLVYTSTTLVYGSRVVGAVDENADPSPESPYADSKVAAERLILAHATTGRLGAVILRVFNVGGGIDGVCDTDPTRIIPALLRVAADDSKSATLVGNGTAMRDFVHVGDVARAIRMATVGVRRGACPIYNIGSGVGSRIIDVFTCVEEVVGREFDIGHTPQEGAPGRLIADISYADRQLGWVPEQSDLRTIISDAWKFWPGRN